MDLRTIGDKLQEGKYKEPWSFIDDCWLMFDNAWLYNEPKSFVYEFCTKLSKIFKTRMIGMGYCCGQRVSLILII